MEGLTVGSVLVPLNEDYRKRGWHAKVIAIRGGLMEYRRDNGQISESVVASMSMAYRLATDAERRDIEAQTVRPPSGGRR